MSSAPRTSSPRRSRTTCRRRSRSAPTRPSTRSTSTARPSSAPRSSSSQGNAYAGDRRPRFASVRYGNVVGSRGSVIPLFKAQAPSRACCTITDERMTRFWITLEQAVDFVHRAPRRMSGGEVFVPKIPSMRVDRHRRALAPEREHRVDRHPAGREAARGPAHRGRVTALVRGRQRLRHP